MTAVSHHDEGGGHFSGIAANAKYSLPSERNLFHTNMVDVGPGANPKEAMEQLRLYFHNTYEVFERVFDCMATEEAYVTPPIHKLRHPMMFYYGHTACFYINKLCVAGLTTRINPKFEEMFAIGVDEMSWDDLNEAHYSWPSVPEVREYRRLVRDRIDEMITSGKFQLQTPLRFNESTDNDTNAFWWVIMMGIEHERIHLETASVHIREMPLQLVNQKQSFWAPCAESGDAPTNELIEVEGEDNVLVGRQNNDRYYGWDCDYSDNLRIDVAPFKASKFLVSNGEFLEFMKDGGYSTEKYWDKEGWGWVSWKKATHPYFWVPAAEGEYRLRVQTEEIALPLNWPAEVNWLEGKAFVNWKGEKTGKKLRFPTEAEWLVMRDRFVKGDQGSWTAGNEPGNINLGQFRSPCPVDKFAQGPFYDIVGNAWQHTETPVYPYKGYRVHPFYDDFSMPTFDGRHAAMKGGAWISTGNEASRDARFAFRRHFYQMIGIRYVEGVEVNEAKHLRSILGMDPEVDAMCDFGFGEGAKEIPNFSVELATFAKSQFKAHAKAEGKRALDLFCGSGRTTFELTDTFEEVIGSDFTARKLMPGFSLRERGQACYSTVATNGLREAKTIEAANFSWNATRERAYFYQADPTNLHAHMDNFDLIVAWNVLERSYKPRAIPAHLVSRLNKGGILIIASTFAWDEEFTQKEDWLSAKDIDDERDPQQEVMHAVAGTTELVSEAIDMSAFFPATERLGTLRKYRVMTFRKN